MCQTRIDYNGGSNKGYLCAVVLSVLYCTQNSLYGCVPLQIPLTPATMYRAWIDYDGASNKLRLTLGTNSTKPQTPLLVASVNISEVWFHSFDWGRPFALLPCISFSPPSPLYVLGLYYQPKAPCFPPGQDHNPLPPTHPSGSQVPPGVRITSPSLGGQDHKSLPRGQEHKPTFPARACSLC